jgi:hypothetical protein
MSYRNTISAAAVAAVAATGLFFTQAGASSLPDEDMPTYSPVLAGYNQALSARHQRVRIDRAELFVTSAGWTASQTLVANDRTHQISSLFVNRDPRRGGSRAISYLVDQSDTNALAFGPNNSVVTLPDSVIEPHIDASMLRWQNAPDCPGPSVVKVADDGSDPDLIDGLVFNDASLLGTSHADITHAGWLPRQFFDALAPNGSASILGVTFSFIFVDDNGNPTDIDHNGRADAAFREIYYNLRFAWSEGPSRPNGIDIESVSTHESGHAFGLGHFGKVFIDNNDVIKFAPRAIMNAVYVSPFTEMTGTDNASFCSIWGSTK